MNELAKRAIDAHGGLDKFRALSFLTADLRQSGILWELKGQAHTLSTASVRVNLKSQEVSHWPFHPTENRSRYTPQEVRIERANGKAVETLADPRASFAGFEMSTHWSNCQLAYFAGYTMWTYLTSPFILAEPGVVSEEVEPWSEQGETWRRLRVTFPQSIATHIGGVVAQRLAVARCSEGDLVAIRHVGARTKEQRTEVHHVVEEVVRVPGHDLVVFGGDAVGLRDHFLVGIADNDIVEILPGSPCDFRRRQDAQEALDFGDGLAGELLRIGQQYCRRFRAVHGDVRN